MIKGSSNKCYKCGKSGHFINECLNNGIKNTPKNSYKKWTIDEEGKLRLLIEKGVSVNTIAKEHGRTIGSIKSRITKLKIKTNALCV